jgi:uncharacterized protein YeaO (DUF488 family)
MSDFRGINMSLRIKRIYDEPQAEDGYRVLVDRLWPRGVSKQRARLDEWCKDVAPSAELRSWFGHRQERFDEFKVRYIEELRTNPAAGRLKALAMDQPTLTLLYAARDPAVNHAIVLLDFIKDSIAREG